MNNTSKVTRLFDDFTLYVSIGMVPVQSRQLYCSKGFPIKNKPIWTAHRLQIVTADSVIALES